MAVSHFHHDQIAEVGFTVIRGFLSQDEIGKYRAAAQRIVDHARAGKWKDVRTRGKQFPPWPENYSPDIWGVGGLMHPQLGDMSVPFQELYSDTKLLDVAGDILQTDNRGLALELFNMLINPLTDFELDWHRDSIKPEVSPQEEAEQLLADPYAGTQFNLALTDDKCLIVVPGSHKRLRTAEERDKTTDDSRKKPISGQITVDLRPGDIVFYNNNILHRAAYSSKAVRLTLHGSYGHRAHGKARARGVLQHGVGQWLDEFRPVNRNMGHLADGLKAVVEEFKGQDLGYAQDT
ncbi:hypothetical protein METBIDRAFT_29827 [Metschnikowia bicuspidata var. bicuspidata NRRL YB-4993]|uniref:Phytanoyl-CoA dioxygenase n=1 Tax=Metschnikowia bicuspidata var. bicuspidata NRRL YB-4993 TaxID=869754 RepID=A0A1A0HGM7_9ASCO|nr:hypothetical protein METBIDRAFT_29827 [Metschnikowia bicuspidata var. bicuspidata NRRL YB-4993]OBA23324.1 hypothetical protein METBIDRAFT_29827 [Metschnikowia bicuspidata var. bicuspidata NRRL YB-4993]